MTVRLCLVSFLFVVSSTRTLSFSFYQSYQSLLSQPPPPPTTKTKTKTTKSWTATATATAMKMSNNNNRDMESLQTWATENGILQENGFTLLQNDNDDWSVVTTKSGTEGTRLLQIPKSMLWSSKRIQKEQPFSNIQLLKGSLDYLKRNKGQFQIPQFYLGLKLLHEYEKQSDSVWYPWIQSLPSKEQFNTAVSMTGLELDCLPPFAWSLAALQQTHMKDLVEAVQMIPTDDGNGNSVISESTRQNPELITWAFCVMFTRCWSAEDDERRNDDDDNDNKDQSGENRTVDVVPVGDMFNHGYPSNVIIHYDDDENCNVILKHDINVTDDDNAAVPLCLSYGQSSNPSRFLSTYGFVDTQQPSIFCQILVERPSKLHVDMGYDNSKMLISTIDGAISEEVWDVVLYTILEQVPELQNAFHHAHTTGNKARKQALKNQFALETAIMIKRHMDRTVQDLTTLIEKIDGIVQNDDGNDDDGENESVLHQHPRLPMIRLHNAFIRDTFIKAQGQLKTFLLEETAKRQKQKAPKSTSTTS